MYSVVNIPSQIVFTIITHTAIKQNSDYYSTDIRFCITSNKTCHILRFFIFRNP